MFDSRSFTVSGFKCKSLINLEQIDDFGSEVGKGFRETKPVRRLIQLRQNQSETITESGCRRGGGEGERDKGEQLCVD